MYHFYPNTLNLLKNNKEIHYKADQYFFTSVSTTKNSNGTLSPGLKKSQEIAFILDCSYNEYFGFIEYVEKLTELLEDN